MVKIHVFIIILTMTGLFQGCASGGSLGSLSTGTHLKPNKMNVSSQPSAEPGSGSFHLTRIQQAKLFKKGDTIGVISGGDFSQLGFYMASALNSREFTVRELDIHSILPSEKQMKITPQYLYNFQDILVREIVNITKTTGAVGTETNDIKIPGNLDIDNLINKLYDIDDITVTQQRLEHYLSLEGKVRELINTLNVDYILVTGSPYKELSYSTVIYDARTLDIVYQNLIVADIEEWRRTVPTPGSEGISINFDSNQEPHAYLDLSYAEYAVSKIEMAE